MSRGRNLLWYSTSFCVFFFSSRRRHTRLQGDWSSDVCSSDLNFSHQACRRASCVYPTVCEKFGTDHAPLIQLMRKARALPGVKRAFVASGIRYDVAFADDEHGDEYIRELVANHVGGHLKIAPEHVSPGVVRVMKKPGKDQFVRFKELFEKYSDEAGEEQYLVPYFISGHPGCEVKDMVELDRKSTRLNSSHLVISYAVLCLEK